MHRRTLNWMGDRHKDKDKEVPLDGVGGVNILVKAEVHRSGATPLVCAPIESVLIVCRHQFSRLRF